MTRDKNYIAPTKRLGPSKREIARRDKKKSQHSTPPPVGLPSGNVGRIEHMRGHAMFYFTEDGPSSKMGKLLWRSADFLEKKECNK